jgi:hypothetical protein
MSKSLSPGFYPFWFWNDALTADEIRWQIEQMVAQGAKVSWPKKHIRSTISHPESITPR